MRLGGGDLVGVEGCGRVRRGEDGGEGGREEGGKEGEVPVFGDVPVKGVEGVQEDEEEPMYARSVYVLRASRGSIVLEKGKHTRAEKFPSRSSRSCWDHNPSAMRSGPPPETHSSTLARWPNAGLPIRNVASDSS